jgi:hypothetical protein
MAKITIPKGAQKKMLFAKMKLIKPKKVTKADYPEYAKKKFVLKRRKMYK